MSHRLIYVIGPSGVGKDSLLTRLREQLCAFACIHWAKRTITRPLDGVSEAHESVTEAEFLALSHAEAFALEWQANGLHYGIRREELVPLARHEWVVLNGSRQYLKDIAESYPGLTVIHITADPDIIRQRLIERGRETEEVIAARLARLITPIIPCGTQLIEIQNNSTIDSACAKLLTALRHLDGWPQDGQSTMAG